MKSSSRFELATGLYEKKNASSRHSQTIADNGMEPILDITQAVENAAQADENVAQADENVAQAAKNAAQADENAAQAHENAAQVDENAAQADENAAQADENAAQADENETNTEWKQARNALISLKTAISYRCRHSRAGPSFLHRIDAVIPAQVRHSCESGNPE